MILGLGYGFRNVDYRGHDAEELVKGRADHAAEELVDNFFVVPFVGISGAEILIDVFV